MLRYLVLAVVSILPLKPNLPSDAGTVGVRMQLYSARATKRTDVNAILNALVSGERMYP